MQSLRAAVVQLSTGYDKEVNRQAAAGACEDAAAQGAKLVVLPELWNAWVGCAADRAHAEALDGPTARFLADLAARTRTWLVAGSMLEIDPADGRYYNTCLVLDDAGRVTATYRKLHLFDVTLDGRDPRRESDVFDPGARIVTASTPWGRLGLSICYDLRFAELYRVLVQDGGTMLSVPAAFSAVTGPAHWQVLLRARAIENQCFVLAAGQCGAHPDGRRSHGHSMTIDPWGRILSQLATDPGVGVADLDFADLARVRRELPCLDHRRITPGGLAPPHAGGPSSPP